VVQNDWYWCWRWWTFGFRYSISAWSYRSEYLSSILLFVFYIWRLSNSVAIFHPQADYFVCRPLLATSRWLAYFMQQSSPVRSHARYRRRLYCLYAPSTIGVHPFGWSRVLHVTSQNTILIRSDVVNSKFHDAPLANAKTIYKSAKGSGAGVSF